MMHAKTVVVDGAWSVVGSANLDERSMELNEENILGIADRDFAGAIEAGVEQDLERSREIHLDQWRKRPVYQKFFERIAKGMIEQY
jgi:cardiolipin synthase